MNAVCGAFAVSKLRQELALPSVAQTARVPRCVPSGAFGIKRECAFEKSKALVFGVRFPPIAYVGELTATTAPCVPTYVVCLSVCREKRSLC